MLYSELDDDGGRSRWTFTPIQIIPAAFGMTAVFQRRDELVFFPVMAMAVVETEYEKLDKHDQKIQYLGWKERNFDAICFGYDDDFFSVKFLHLWPDWYFREFQMNGKTIDLPSKKLNEQCD